MSFAIIQTVLRKPRPRYEARHRGRCQQDHEVDTQRKGGYFLEVRRLAELERPTHGQRGCLSGTRKK